MIVSSRCGTASRRITAVAAIASGGEMMAPSANAAAQGREGMAACATAATASIVMSTKPIARNRIGRRFRRKSRQDVNRAVGYNSSGRKKKKTTSGSNVTLGSPGITLMNNPPSTSSAG